MLKVVETQETVLPIWTSQKKEMPQIAQKKEMPWKDGCSP